MALDPLTAFTVEAWTYLGLSLIVVAIRFGARWRWMGLGGLAPDDYLMVLAGLLFTAETATAHFVGAYWQGLANNAMTDEQRAGLDPDSDEYYRRVHGSQTQLFGWLVYTVLLWCLKLCWLFFFKRLGDGVDNMTLKINIGFAIVGVTFFGTFFTILCSCWPIYKKWQIYPDPGNTCYPAVSHVQAWTLIWTNLSTDLYIMSIPLPMVWNANIPRAKKIALIVIFCGGLITAVFGGLRCGYVLQGGVEGPQRAGEWSCRESFVAMVVTNLPVLTPLIQRGVRRARIGYSGYNGSGSAGTPGVSKGSSRFQLTTIGGKGRKKAAFKHPLSLPGETFYERYGSEEEIVEGGQNPKSATNPDSESYRKNDGKGGEEIVVTTQWNVEHQESERHEVDRESKKFVTAGY
ncbi:Hypothetical protein NCS54_00982000 [Fusarium falciforme]|uniref:Hypothetical protein n=1 Tax=Fusarium falciforme TaxID=195108 RepID=UPI0023005655|nr:Hypothetical protein NCS54_00982000 [Fusarium falciforme]WAO92316.1 Hypothetical protein NCS54_00982000 [Fusarium falciforme]